MSKAWIVVGIIIGFALGCNNIREKLLPAFTINIPPINLRIPPLPFLSTREIPVGALRTQINMDSAIRANTAGTLGAAAVHSVKVKNIVLTTSNADANNNLSNFETARIRIFDDTSFVDIATISFPEGASDSLVIFPTASPDIIKYLQGKSLAYNLYWKNRSVTTRPLQLQIRIALSVQ